MTQFSQTLMLGMRRWEELKTSRKGLVYRYIYVYDGICNIPGIVIMFKTIELAAVFQLDDFCSPCQVGPCTKTLEYQPRNWKYATRPSFYF